MAEDSRRGDGIAPFAEAVERWRREQQQVHSDRKKRPSGVARRRKASLPSLTWEQKAALATSTLSTRQRERAAALALLTSPEHMARQKRRARVDVSFRLLGSHLDYRGRSSVSRTGSRRRYTPTSPPRMMPQTETDLLSCVSDEYDKIDVSGSGVLEMFPATAISLVFNDVEGGEEPCTDNLDSERASEVLQRTYNQVESLARASEREQQQQQQHEENNTTPLEKDQNTILNVGSTIGFDDSLGSLDDFDSIATEAIVAGPRDTATDSSLLIAFQSMNMGSSVTCSGVSRGSCYSRGGGGAQRPLSNRRPNPNATRNSTMRQLQPQPRKGRALAALLTGDRVPLRPRARSASRPRYQIPLPDPALLPDPAPKPSLDRGTCDRPASQIALSIKSLKSKSSQNFTILQDSGGKNDNGWRPADKGRSLGQLPLLSDYAFVSLLADTDSATASIAPQRALSSQARRDELLLRKMGYREGQGQAESRAALRRGQQLTR